MNELNLHFLTFNMGGTSGFGWDEIFKENGWPEFFGRVKNDRDVWVICTQEDKFRSTFHKALKTVFLPTSHTIDTFKCSCLLPSFQVILSVVYPNQSKSSHTYKSMRHKSEMIKYLQNVFFHKGSIITQYTFFGKFHVGFTGSHFPFNPKDETNVSHRRSALESVLDHSKNTPITFILGDLNFRLNQLDNLISGDLSTKNITDLTKNLAPSCKMTPGRKPDCHEPIDCRKLNVPIIQNAHNATRLQINEKEIELELLKSEFAKECYNARRSKSLCDRLLMMQESPDYAYDVVSRKHITLHPVTFSDHNAIYVHVKLEEKKSQAQDGGVLMRKTKRTYATLKRTKLGSRFIMG